MSEGDVTLIQDEDLLRRMWQQTEDFSRKKEIRAHMYRLREERLRNLYSPEPSLDPGKGCEFTSTQGHVKSFADQSFQSMKSKEVRDAGSPPKDFTYRGQELKELSNAGWNVESENRTADDGHVRVKSVQANIQGRYDVESGKGQFSAIDLQKEAITDFHDDNTSLKKNETTSHTAAHEQVVRKTDDGAQFSSETSSSTSSSKFQKVSSVKHETVPYVSNDDYDSSRQTSYDNNRTVENSTNKQIIRNEYDQKLRTEFEHGELESRKVEYPDSDTKVIIETRRLPDGSTVTSTRREMKGPAVHSSLSEHHSQIQKSKSEHKSSSTSTHTISDVKESSAKTTRENISNITNNIVDSQRNRDNYDFNRNMETDLSWKQKEDFSQTTRHRFDQQHYETDMHTTNKEHYDHQDIKTKLIDNKLQNQKVIDQKQNETKIETSKQYPIDTDFSKSDKSKINKLHNIDIERHETKQLEVKEFDDNEQRVHVINTDIKMNENEQKKINDEYQTTYQSDFSQKKVSMDWSPTHQAWASTLRADTPPTTRPSTRASSPGGRTFKSSTSSLRSSVSPDKVYKKPSSRSQSPSKVNRYSPTKSPDRNQPHITTSKTDTEIKYPNQSRQRLSLSPDKKLSVSPKRSFVSPDRKPSYDSQFIGDDTPRNISPTRPIEKNTPTEQNSQLESCVTSPSRPNIRRSPEAHLHESRAVSPTKPPIKDNHKFKLSPSPERKPKHQPTTSPSRTNPEMTHTNVTKSRSSVSPDRKPGYMRATASSKSSETIDKPNASPKRHYDTTDKETTARPVSPSQEKKPLHDSFNTKITEHHNKFVDEETKSHTRSTKDFETVNTENRKSTTRIYAPRPDETKPTESVQSIRPTLKTNSRSPSPTKGPVTFTQEDNEFSVITDKSIEYDVASKYSNQNQIKTNQNKNNHDTADNFVNTTFIRGESPSKFGTYTKKQYEKDKQNDSLKHHSTSEIDKSDIETKGTKTETHDNRKLIQRKDYKDDKINTLPRQEKTTTSRRSSESPKKSFRDSVSPQKSPSKDSKLKMTTEFIATERTSEEMKRTPSPKNRPRQLVTPSTSPTRKPKSVDTAPSTGQSSPTTSVSGFIYYSSPRTEQVTETEKLVSDFNKIEQTALITSDEKHNSKKTSSHSKIPCRSPSPDKCILTTDGAPRKSSLKKPTKETNLDSPVEKPRSSFRISPPVETVEIAEHKIIKKDRPDKPDSNTAKPKPPLERRETYEERCRKILGMMDDNNSNTKKDTPSLTNVLKSETSSTSVSPCSSPDMKDITGDTISKKNTETKYDVTDFISREKESARKSSPTKLEDIISKESVESNTKVLTDENIRKTIDKNLVCTLQEETIKKAPEKQSNIPTRLGHPKKPEELKLSRSPSPSKKFTSHIDQCTELISSEKEQEILDKVQKSLRKLSPNRKEKSPNREKSPSKSSTSLQDLEISKEEKVDIYEYDETSNKINTNTEKSKISHDSKILKQKIVDTGKSTASKFSARNVSPVKKPTSSSSKVDKCPESPTKHRSISPRKPFSERPQSPQISKSTNFKNKEPFSTHRFTSSGGILSTKTEKLVSTDTKKVSNVTKHNSFTNKTAATKSVTNKVYNKINEVDAKGASVTKVSKESPIAKKDLEIKVTRTATDTSIKTKKSSPQRLRSKPEIQINDSSTTKTPKQNITLKTKKSTYSEPHKLTNKPKSATTLNTPSDEDDIIIDVQQAKSSRENSPDRICPTPINLLDDVSTPRLPDEVSEPDDELRKRSHHIIHEAESIVDDIVEISEEDELFSRMSNVNRINETDVSRFSRLDVINNQKDTAEMFKSNEIKKHSDFKNKDLQSDECLLTVSEKVNKFAKGSPETKDHSPQRRITDGYDTNTVYQDDYTKLSVNDKAHLFVETAENLKIHKTKSTHKIERPDLTNVDESLKSDDCLLSVSDKVNKFVRTAEQSLVENQNLDNKENKITTRYEKATNKNTENIESLYTKKREKVEEEINMIDRMDSLHQDDKSFAKETASSHAKAKDYVSPNLKSTEKISTTKITTLRSSDAVKKAKALFENIASTTHKPKDETPNRKATKLTDIGVIKKSPKTDSTMVLHPSLEEGSPNNTDVDSETDNVVGRHNQPDKKIEGKVRSIPSRNSTPEVPRTKTPQFPPTDFNNSTKPAIPRQPDPQINESIKPSLHHDFNKQEDRIPGYQRPTKTSQLREETKVVEETEISSRRGSGKFGVELRRTSIERSTVSSERRRSSVEHHQPCIEDIFDLDLLEQMLGKVVGYEQRRRIRAQMRVAKKKMENENTVEITNTKTVRQSTVTRSPERRTNTKSPERIAKSKPRIVSPIRSQSKEPNKTTMNGHSKKFDLKAEPEKTRPYSPDKDAQKSTPQTKSPSRHTSPEGKKTSRALSPNKIVSKPKTNRFSEYATAYMKKVGINEADKFKLSENKATKTTSFEVKELNQSEESNQTTSISKRYSERSSSKNTMEVVIKNGKSSPSPAKKHSPERTQISSGRLHQRTPSPDFKRPTNDDSKIETTSKTVYGIDKKIQPKQIQEEKPSWVTNRNLKKVTAETRTFNSKKLEVEKPKYRSKSPSKALNKPIDVITSSYGPGPLDSDGRPLFGIRALRKGTSNYQVKGTVIRQEYHSRNGGEPEGTVSVTAYSTEPEELQELLQTQGHRPPGRMHGLAAITTTKKFGGDTGTTLAQAHTKEEHASLEQFTHNDRRTAMHREDRKTVRQSSVKSLTEKYIKSATETSKSERSTYPKAGLILRSANIKDNASSESSVHAGLGRTDSEHSLASMEETVTSSTRQSEHKSFLDSTTKVTGVQDILTRMKNADIVIDESDTNEDREARALLNKFLGATVLMAGMQSYVTESSAPGHISHQRQETVRSSSDGRQVTTTRTKTVLDIDQCWDERVLKKLLEECTDYEQRRRLRTRIRTLMAEQEACASAVTDALAAAGESPEAAESGDAREEEEVTTVTSSVRRNSSEKTTSSSTTTKTSKVIESTSRPAPKPVSPFAKFRQLEKSNSTNSSNSAASPQSPSSGQPMFKFTDPALQASANTIKERLLQWCRDKTRDYENVKLENFSTSWADGLAFCALIHHFLPDAFDYNKLTPERRRHNFTLAFKVADEKAGIYPLLDVDDMVSMRKPDWKCVFTYVQAIHRRFKDN